MSRGSILCLFASRASEEPFSQTQPQLVCAKTNDLGGRQGNMVRIVVWWQLPEASNVAQDILHWVMFSVLHWEIAKAIKNDQQKRCIFLQCGFGHSP